MRWTPELLDEAKRLVAQLGTYGRAAAALQAKTGLPVTSNAVRNVLIRNADCQEMTGTVVQNMTQTSDSNVLLRRIELLQADLATAEKKALDDEIVKREILGVRDTTPTIPDWVTIPCDAPRSPGVPSLLLSDVHYGEVVDASQIQGVNAYDMDIGEQRMQRLGQIAGDLLLHHLACPEYPGIVLLNAGDNFSGDIHPELTETNETAWAPVFVRYLGIHLAFLKNLADLFGRVFFVGVPGNHSRTTQKVHAKNFNYKNTDWLLYQMLRMHLVEDSRFAFLVPDGPDVLYRVYQHRYLLTHGNQFRGGDGLIGALGPLTRGDHKKRARNVQIHREYDTLVVGHFHSLMLLRRLIVNGSVVGYNEYAHQNNLPFEDPMQALWITHPDRGITFSMPVQLGEDKKSENTPWVSWS